MPTLAQALNAVTVGDVIFGIGSGGQEKLLFVYKADPQGFSARHVTTQMTFRFGRDGRTRVYVDGGYIAIVSTARLPADMYEVALGLDRKFAARPEYPGSILTEAEIQLVLTNGKFFKANLIPGTEAIVKAAEKLNAVRKILQLEWDPINARANPPAWDEYDVYLAALVELLEKPASADEVADFLADIAARRKRVLDAPERHNIAAAGLLRSRQSWV